MVSQLIVIFNAKILYFRKTLTKL